MPILDAAAAEVAAEGLLDGWQIGRPNGVEPGVAFLAPLDPLAWDRELLLRLWDFDYKWEVYVPAPKRRWGYYVLPMLYGDRFAGRIELRHDRQAPTLRVLGMWWEPGFDPSDERNPGFADAFADAAPRPPRLLGAAAGDDAAHGRPPAARRGHPGPPRAGREGGWPGGRHPVGTASTRRDRSGRDVRTRCVALRPCVTTRGDPWRPGEWLLESRRW